MSNSAQRLHSLLTKAREKENSKKTMILGWRNVMDLPDDMDDMVIMNKVGKVLTLPHVISLQIQRFNDIDHDLYLGWRKDLTIAFQHINFHANFAEFSSKLSDSLLINIRFCAHELDKRMPEKDISDADLASLRDEANKLFDSILAADLPQELSRYLLDHIYQIVEAIDDYVISGSPMLEAVLNQAIGTVATARPLATQVKDSTFGENFWKLIGRVSLILSISKSAAELGPLVKSLFFAK